MEMTEQYERKGIILACVTHAIADPVLPEHMYVREQVLSPHTRRETPPPSHHPSMHASPSLLVPLAARPESGTDQRDLQWTRAAHETANQRHTLS